MAGAEDVAPLADRLETVAAGIESRQSDDAVIALLCLAQQACDRLAAHPAQGAAWSTLGQALQTWQQVWARLGGQRDFRLAVAREARLWAKRLASGVPQR